MLGLKEIHVSKTGPKSEFPSDNTGWAEGFQNDKITSGAASDDIVELFYNCGNSPVPAMRVVRIVPEVVMSH